MRIEAGLDGIEVGGRLVFRIRRLVGRGDGEGVVGVAL